MERIPEVIDYLNKKTDQLPEQIKEYYNSKNYIFSIALHQVTNYQIYMLIHKKKVSLLKNVIYEDVLIHSFCVIPDRSDEIIDAKGRREIVTIKKDFLLDHSSKLVKTSPLKLLNMIGDVWFSEEFQKELCLAKVFILTHYNL